MGKYDKIEFFCVMGIIMAFMGIWVYISPKKAADQKPVAQVEKVDDKYDKLEISQIVIFNNKTDAPIWQYTGRASVEKTDRGINVYFIDTIPNPSNTNTLIRVPKVASFMGPDYACIDEYIPR